jgi:hypothetical protein
VAGQASRQADRQAGRQVGRQARQCGQRAVRCRSCAAMSWLTGRGPWTTTMKKPTPPCAGFG